MKRACNLAGSLNRVLLAGAGSRRYDVDNDEVAAWKKAMSESLSEDILSSIDAQLAAEGVTWEDLDLPPMDDSGAPPAGDSSYQWGRVSEENITDFSKGDPFADDTQAERQKDLNAFKGKVGDTFNK